MNKSLLFRNRFYEFCLILFSFFILLYLVYYFIASDRGLLNYVKLKNEFNNKSTKYNNLMIQKNDLKNNISKLNPNNIDLDYLDELSRKKNGFTKNNEIIVILSND